MVHMGPSVPHIVTWPPCNAAKCTAQRLHRIEVWITRSADGKTGKAFVGDMTEDKSIEMASKLVSEGFVFTVSAHASKNKGTQHIVLALSLKLFLSS